LIRDRSDLIAALFGAMLAIATLASVAA